jgi:hypothetical protein
MSRNVGYRWHLRLRMAERGVFATTELGPLLAERGVALSREQVYRLAAGTLAAHVGRAVRHPRVHPLGSDRAGGRIQIRCQTRISRERYRGANGST